SRRTTRPPGSCTPGSASPCTMCTTTTGRRNRHRNLRLRPVTDRRERARTGYAFPPSPVPRTVRRGTAALRRGGPVGAAGPGHAVPAGGRGGGRHAGRGGPGRRADRAGPAGRAAPAPAGRPARVGARPARPAGRAVRLPRHAGRLPAPGVVAAARGAAAAARAADPAVGGVDGGGPARRGAGVRGGAARALRRRLRAGRGGRAAGARRPVRRGAG